MHIETRNNPMPENTADSGNGSPSGQGEPVRTTPDTSPGQNPTDMGPKGGFRVLHPRVVLGNPTSLPSPSIDLSAQQRGPDTQGTNGPTSGSDPGNDEDNKGKGNPTNGGVATPPAGSPPVPPGGGGPPNPPSSPPPSDDRDREYFLKSIREADAARAEAERKGAKEEQLKEQQAFIDRANWEAKVRAEADQKARDEIARKQMEEKIRIWVDGKFTSEEEDKVKAAEERRNADYGAIIAKRRIRGEPLGKETMNRINETARNFARQYAERGQDPEQAGRTILEVINWLYQETGLRPIENEFFSMWIPVGEESVRKYLSFIQEISSTPDNPLANLPTKRINQILIDLGLHQWEVMDSRSEAGYPEKMLKPRDPNFLIPLITSQLQALEDGQKFSTEDRFKGYMNLAFGRVLTAMDNPKYEKLYDELIAEYDDQEDVKTMLEPYKENVNMARRMSALKTVRAIMHDALGKTESTVSMKDIAAAIKSISFLAYEDWMQMPGMDVAMNVLFGLGRRGEYREYPIAESYPILDKTKDFEGTPEWKVRLIYGAHLKTFGEDGEPTGKPAPSLISEFREDTRLEIAQDLLRIAEGIKNNPNYNEYQRKMILAFKEIYEKTKDSGILQGLENCARRTLRAFGTLVETHRIVPARDESGNIRKTPNGEIMYEWESNKAAEYAWARLLLPAEHNRTRQNISAGVNMDRGVAEELYGKWDIFQGMGSFITAYIRDGIPAQGDAFVIKYQNCVKIIREPEQETALTRARAEFEQIEIKDRELVKEHKLTGKEIPFDHQQEFAKKQRKYAMAIRPTGTRDLISKNGSLGIVYESFDFTKVDQNAFSYWNWAKGTGLFDWMDIMEKADLFRTAIAKLLKFPTEQNLIECIIDPEGLDYVRANKPAALEDLIRAYLFHVILNKEGYLGAKKLEKDAESQVGSLRSQGHITVILEDRLLLFCKWVRANNKLLVGTREGYLLALNLFEKYEEGELKRMKQKQEQKAEKREWENKRILASTQRL